MPDEEKVLRKLEDIEAKISQLEDRVLTNELDFQELRTEVKGDEEAPTPDVLEKRLANLEERLKDDLKDVEKWKDGFDKITDKLDWLEERVSEKGSAGPVAEERIEELEDTVEEMKKGRMAGEGETVDEETLKNALENSALKEDVEELKTDVLALDMLKSKIDSLEEMIGKQGVEEGISEEDVVEIVEKEVEKKVGEYKEVKSLREEMESMREMGEKKEAMDHDGGPTEEDVKDMIDSLEEEYMERTERRFEDLEKRVGKRERRMEKRLDQLRKEIENLPDMKKVVDLIEVLHKEIESIKSRNERSERKRPFVIE